MKSPIQNQDITVAGGVDLPSDLVGDSNAAFDVPTDSIDRRLVTLLQLNPTAQNQFRQADLATMDQSTRQFLLDDLCQVLKIPQVHSAQL